MGDNLLSADRIYKHYGPHTILQDVSLRVQPGQIVTLIGPNGSGKTTLLKILLGLEKPDSGSVWRQPRLRIGYMPQRMTIDPVLPITVGWFLKLYSPDVDSISFHAQVTHLSHLMRSRMQDLSGGELQRVLLARALLKQPELLVLDEPVQGVDVTGQADLYDLVAQVRKDIGCAVLMVSHDLHLVMSATDEVICLNHHVCCAGHPHSVRSDPAFVQLFGAHVAESLAVYTHHHDHAHQ